MAGGESGVGEGLAFQFGANDATIRAMEMNKALLSAPVLAMWAMAFEAWNPVNYFPLNILKLDQNPFSG